MAPRAVPLLALLLSAAPAVASRQGLVGGPPRPEAKSRASTLGPQPPVLVLMPHPPACAGAAEGREPCAGYASAAAEARLGALAAIDGRDATVLGREQLGVALAERLLPPPCDSGEAGCSAEAARGLEAHWIVVGRFAPESGSAGAQVVTLELRYVGNQELAGSTRALPARRGRALRDAAEAMVRSVLEPEPLGRRPRPAGEERPDDVLIELDSSRGGIVSVDGRLACLRLPCARRLAPGPHEARFEQVEHDPDARRFTAADGVAVVGAPAPRAVPNRLGVVQPGYPGCEHPLRNAEPHGPRRCQLLRALALNGFDGARAALDGTGGEPVESLTTVEFGLHARDFWRCTDPARCALEKGRMLGARWILTAVEGAKGGTATYELRELASGRLLASAPAVEPWKEAAAAVVRDGLGLGGPSPLVTAAGAASRPIHVPYDSEPEPGAVVRVDGRFVGVTNWTVSGIGAWLLPGPHEFTFEKHRYAPVTLRVEAAKGAAATATLAPDFGFLGLPRPPPGWTFDVVADDGRKEGPGRVDRRGRRVPWLDGWAEWGELPWGTYRQGFTWREVDAGEVELTAQHPCYLPVRERPRVAPGEQHEFALPTKPRVGWIEVHAFDEEGAAAAVPLQLDGHPAGSTGEAVEAPICHWRGAGLGYGPGPQLLSVRFRSDTWAGRVPVHEGQVSVVEARPAPRGREGEMATIPGRASPTVPPSEAALSPFLLDATEVTVRAYARCVNAGECAPPPLAGARPETWLSAFDFGNARRWPLEGCTWGTTGEEDHPVNCVSFKEASAYCAWAGKRLPTADELAWALAGAGLTTPRAPRRTPDDELACVGSRYGAPIRLERGFRHTCRVGAFPGGDGPLGVQDLEGNVSEWTSTVEADPAAFGPGSPPAVTRRVWIGTSWEWPAGSGRGADPPGARLDTLGFRCARDP